MRIIGIDLGRNLGAASCEDGSITQAELWQGPDATKRLCAWLRAVHPVDAVYWEPSLWLPGRRGAFTLVEQQRGAIQACCDAVYVSVSAQEVRFALLGSRLASGDQIIDWVSRAGLGCYLPYQRRDATKVHKGNAAHVCDAMLLALYGHSREARRAWLNAGVRRPC